MNIGILGISGRPIGNDRYGICAPNTIIADLANSLIEKNNNVYVFTGRDSSVSGEKISLGQSSPISMNLSRSEYLDAREKYHRNLSKEAVKLFTEGKLDIINSHDFRYGRDAFMEGGAKVLFTIHERLRGNSDKYDLNELKRFSDAGGGFANISKENLAFCKDHDISTYGYVPNGIDTNLFKPKKTKRQMSVLYVGRIIEGKKIVEMIEASHKLGLKITIAGIAGNTGDDKEYFNKVKRKYFGKAGVDYLGYIQRSHLSKLYSKHKVFLFLSKSEGMPLSVLESMSCGCGVVASDVGGIKDIIDSGQDGYLLESEGIDAISKGIKNVLGMKPEGIRSKIVNKFSLDAMAKNYLDAYQLFIG